jgi:hypothetical protein
MAIAVPNIASRTALASETHLGHNPRINKVPRVVSMAVAVHASNGTKAVGTNESTCAAYCRKFAKCFMSTVLSHRPKREATAERNAVPSATRA